MLQIESLRTVGLSSSVISRGTWQTLDTTASRQRPGNSTYCLASLPSLVLEKLVSGFFRRPCVEMSFVFVVPGIPSCAHWLDEPGALVGFVRLPRHSRTGQAIAQFLAGLGPDGCFQASPFTSKLFHSSDLITAFCELPIQHSLFRLGYCPCSLLDGSPALASHSLYATYSCLGLQSNNGYLWSESLFKVQR